MEKSAIRNPQSAILLACARSMLTARHVERIHMAAASGIDENTLIEAAQRHGVSFFVASHLQRLAAAGVVLLPDSLLARLRDCRRRVAARGMLLLHQQLRLARALAEAQLSGVWLKGLGLSQQLYGCYEARESGDLDVLVEHRHRDAAEQCLAQCGFRRYRDPEPGKDQHFMNAHHSTWCLPVMDESRVAVELHDRLAGPAACQPRAVDIVQRARMLVLQGRTLLVPSQEDELLILCLHAHHHNYGVLRCVMDVAEYVRAFHQQIHWTRFVELAHASRSFGRVLGTLHLARDLLDLDNVPVEFAHQNLGPVQQRVLTGRSAEQWLSPDTEQDDWLRVRLGVLMDCWSDVIRLLGPHVFPSRLYLRARYGSTWARLPGLGHGYHLAQLARRLWRAKTSRRDSSDVAQPSEESAAGLSRI